MTSAAWLLLTTLASLHEQKPSVLCLSKSSYQTLNMRPGSFQYLVRFGECPRPLHDSLSPILGSTLQTCILYFPSSAVISTLYPSVIIFAPHTILSAFPLFRILLKHIMSSIMDRQMSPTSAEIFAEYVPALNLPRSHNRLTLSRSLTSNAGRVKIYIGEKTPESNPYEVSKAILLRYDYFRKALSAKWREGQEAVLHFPQDSKEAWAVWLGYLYGREVEWFGLVEDLEQNTQCDDYRGDKNLLTMAQAYLLADMYLLPPSLKNKIIRVCMKGCFREQVFYDETYLEFFNLIERDCPLRRIVIENLVLWVQGVLGIETLDEAGYEWLKELPDVWGDLKECFVMRELGCGGWSRMDPLPPYLRLKKDDARMKKYFVYDPEEDEEGKRDDSGNDRRAN